MVASERWLGRGLTGRKRVFTATEIHRKSCGDIQPTDKVCQCGRCTGGSTVQRFEPFSLLLNTPQDGVAFLMLFTLRLLFHSGLFQQMTAYVNPFLSCCTRFLFYLMSSLAGFIVFLIYTCLKEIKSNNNNNKKLMNQSHR